MQDMPDLHLQWSDADESSYVNDLVGPIEQVGDDAHEPVDTLALAVAGAIAGEALGKALDHEWAVYTPQHAAVVASALAAQIAQSVENLQKLVKAVEHVGERGEASLPALSDAVDRLRTAADTIAPLLDSLVPAVATLSAAASSYEEPTGVHDTLAAVAAHLGNDASINAGDAATHKGSHCSCVVTFTRSGEVFYLDYDDMGWSLLRDSDAKHTIDDTKVWTNGGSLELGLKDEMVHPSQLVAAVRSAVE